MSEIGCVVESPVKLGLNSDIRLKSTFMDQLGAGDLVMRSLDKPLKIIDGGSIRAR
ncbi:MAG: hypothetical protein H7301_12060 [Cryobacterium sp.]|nr:hypothetical protein [Oligoflexia bacterium]